ncbi:tandem-95 repeat protein [Enterovibrio sp. ZSDZ35]|uniref:Tandem-95 repeat protein n=1 Tax=Enterovibrio qingdaonensis TaxID=2899818 RepID=A0ABT5QHK2_9GAMM|nr:tandem-95 repeat protein [Enterovibrio sp. ZSDZ35]MDD1780460.1 tandem-95 repeat protein [Enterovibrio sp. ZSDZ35]
MSDVRIPVGANVVFISGKAALRNSSQTHEIQVGEHLQQDQILDVADNSLIAFQSDGGEFFLYNTANINAFDSFLRVDSSEFFSDQEIVKIVEFIQLNKDPTVDEENATASGSAPTSSGTHGFFTLDRNASETIATAGFDTEAYANNNGIASTRSLDESSFFKAPTVDVFVDTLTNDNTPTITGTTNLLAGSSVKLTISDATGNVLSLSAVVQADGSFSIVVPQSLSDGQFSVVATIVNNQGQSASATVTGTIDTTAPGEGTGPGGTDELPLVDIPEATGGVGESEVSDGIEVQVTPPTGTESGDTITVTVTQPDGDISQVITTVPNGWTGGSSVSVTVSPEDLGASSGQLPDEGDYTITASITDSAGNTSASSADADFTIDTTAPGEGTGPGGTDELPLVTIPEATGGVGENEVSDGIEVQVTPPTGTELGDTITVTVTQPDGDITQVIATVPNGWTGGTSVSVTVSPEDLGASTGQLPDEGDYTITATITDSAGNTSATSTDSDFTIDTTAPGEGTGPGGTDELPLVTIPEATGGVGENEVSNGIEVQVTPPTGTESGDTITVTVTQPDGDITEVIATVPNGWTGGSSISVTVSPEDLGASSGQLPEEGDYTITATITDSAGNTSVSSTDSDFTIDTTAPGEGTGPGGSDELPLVAIPEATGGVGENEVSDGIEVQITPPTGTEPGDTITVTVTQPDGDITQVIASVPNGWTDGSSVSVTVSPEELGASSGQLPDEGDYTITATITDSAGNTSASSADSDFTIDTTAPGEGTGPGGTDELPLVTIPEATGGVGENEVSGGIEVQVTPPTGTEPGDTITVTVTQPDGDITQVIATVPNGWTGGTSVSVTVSPEDLGASSGQLPDEGNYTITATVTDSAGNTSTSSTDSDFTIDTTASSTPTVTLADDTNNDGLINSQEHGSDDVQMTVSVDHDDFTAGGVVTIVINNDGTSRTENLKLVSGTLHYENGSTASSYSYNNGTISWNEVVAAGDSISVSATQTDSAGNLSNSASDSAIATQASNESASTLEDVALNGNVLTNDAGNTSVTQYSVAGSSTVYTAGQTAVITGIGSFVLNTNGSYTFTPEANWNGLVPDVTYTTNSGDTATVAISVTSVDEAVDAVNDTYSVDEDSTLSLDLLSNDNAPDGGLEVTHINGVALVGGTQTIAVDNGNVLIANDGSMSFKADANYFGSVSFNYQVKDSDGDTDTATINITVNSVNDNPDAIDDTLTMTDAGAIASGYTGNAIDTQIIEGYGTGKVDDSAYMTTTHADGSYTVVFRAWDTNYHGNNKVVLQSFNADGSLKGDKLTLGSRDKIESPQVTQLNDDGDLLVTWTGYNNSTTLNTHSYAQVVYANPDDHGGATTGPEMDLGTSALRSVTSEHSEDNSMLVWVDNFTLYMQVLDSSGDKVGSAQVVGSVSANSNGYPIVSNPEITVLDNGNYVVSWSQGSTATATNTVMYSSTGSKIGSTQTLNIGGTDGNADKETNVVSISGDKYAIVGSSGGTVTLTLVDATTNAPIAGSTQTLNLAGTTSNDMPSITNVGPDGDFVVVWRGIENGQWQTYIQHFDADGSKDQPVSKLEAPGGHGPAKVVGVGDDGDYVIVWSAINANGDYDVHTQKYNADGTKDGDQLTFTGQQENQNDLNFDIVAVGDEGAYTISFLGTDSSANGGDYSIYIASVDANGNKVVAYPSGSTGDFSITTEVVLSSGYYSVTYSTGTLYANGTAYPTGSQVPASEWVDVKLVGATGADYDLVVTAHEQITTTEDTAVTINASDLLANDTDTEGNSLTITSVQSPQNGTVVLNGDGTITFTPTADYNGSASFTYTISDGQGGTDTATVYLNVTPDALDAVNDEYTLSNGGPVALDLLANDTTTDSGLEITEINGVALTGSAQSIAVDNGDVLIASDGSMSFVPDSNFYGQIAFDYQIQSDNGDSDTATVSIAGDADKPTLSISNTNTNNEMEESQWAQFTISLSDPVAIATKVEVNVLTDNGSGITDQDLGSYQYWTGSTWAHFKSGSQLTLDAFQTEIKIRIQPINDNTTEASETLTITVEPATSETNISSGTAQDSVLITDHGVYDTSGNASGYLHWHIDGDGVQHVNGNGWHPNEKVTLSGPDGSEHIVYADSVGNFHLEQADLFTAAGTLTASGESSGDATRFITPSITPIVLDLDGDGIETSDVTENPVAFDYNGDGTAVNTGWVSGGDGLLVHDINKDGEINDGSELFGSNTELKDGTNAADGYEALAQHDTNADGVIDQNDAIYSELGVWVDKDMDGKTDEGELLSLEDAGVASISLAAQTSDDTQNNNLLGKTSTYTTLDGEERAAADVWFATQQTGEDETNLAGLVEEHSINGLDNSELIWHSDNVNDQPWSDTVTDFTVGESHLDLSDLVTDQQDNLLSEADVDLFEQDGSLVLRVDTDGDHEWNQEIILQDVSLQDIVDENGMIKNGVFGDDSTKELFQKAAATDVVENSPTLLDDPTVDHH